MIFISKVMYELDTMKSAFSAITIVFVSVGSITIG